MDKYMFLDASMEGTLVLRVQTEEATIKTFYTNLVPRFGAFVRAATIVGSCCCCLVCSRWFGVSACVRRADGLDEEDAIHNRASVKLDIRKFVSVLNCYNIPHDSIICCECSFCNAGLQLIITSLNALLLLMRPPALFSHVLQASSSEWRWWCTCS